MTELVDKYNRHLNYLRISITDRCNLRCLYCAPGGLVPKLAHDKILRYEEILRIIRLGVRLGISKVRLTGGEPLMRQGVYEFIKELVTIDGLSDISLTTNGVMLLENIEKIEAAGIKRINISLDTLNREKFKHITGYDLFDQVWAGIEKAYALGFNPIKLNVVALKGYNDDEFVDLARLSLTYPFHIRFIEYMPIGNAQMKSSDYILADDIRVILSVLGDLVPVTRKRMDGPAQRYRIKGARGEIGFIQAMSHHFCHTCNRLRLTANGQLRPCLLSDKQLDIRGPLRSGCSDDDLKNVFLRAVQHKHESHHSAPGSPFRIYDNMSDIGG
ncbi:MAG: GTP 3',8-cyclase MoaA [Deltaproteobacteria bacterium]|nr:MAG: GTP 3',8-cyclase MoaA [Deltaproteobacteria bacterium]HHE74257.1 GTP 3',8-cyclase MoaA [Desulfobacteraceae bacterium]